jgi:hypothetical protein
MNLQTPTMTEKIEVSIKIVILLPIFFILLIVESLKILFFYLSEVLSKISSLLYNIVENFIMY